MKSGLFDSDFYGREYPDIARNTDYLSHFLDWGAAEFRRPNALFDTEWYVRHNPEILVSEINPLVNYLNTPTDPNPLFDRDWYTKTYPETLSAGLDPLAHFIRHGASEGRSPHPAFSVPFYTSSWPDGVPGGANPLEYYLQHGRAIGHEPNTIFDTTWYLERLADKDVDAENPLVHYLAQDADSGFDPSPAFSTIGYMLTYASVRADGWNALAHYLAIGRSEGREPGGFPSENLPLSIAIIAEVSIPQCLKYRVTQKQEMIISLGYQCSVYSWRDLSECVDALRTHSMIIFYRVPAYPEMIELMYLAKRAGIEMIWEVDDLIFSGKDYLTNRNLDDLSPELQRLVLSGTHLYQKALTNCGVGIASTPGVADAMRRVGIDEVFVIENALDQETLLLAADLVNARTVKSKGSLTITYGSGGKTHDTDFKLVAKPLLALLNSFPSVMLHIVGELNVPADFIEVENQIERWPVLPFPDYLALLAKSDLTICPVEDTAFSDAKSNIKYLEASILTVPSVCSPRSAYRSVLRHGQNGLFAETAAEWSDALRALVTDGELRRRLGLQARQDVLARYDPGAIARRQVAPMLDAYSKPKASLRVLSVNTYYNPQSFGGATIVAEQMNKRLNARADTQVTVFTGHRVDTGRPYRLTRDAVDGCSVFRVEMPLEQDPATDFDNPRMKPAFRDALHASGANVVHLHAIQGLSAALLEVCVEEGVPAIVTLHDAWWICGRMFMVTGDNKYCGQWEIDVDVCASCVSDAGLNYFRQLRLRNLLSLADEVLTPSSFFRDLYLANGLPAELVKVNRNGVQPADKFVYKPSDALRLGFVGGVGPIKGLPIIRAALEGLSRADYRLILVDNTVNLGFSSVNVADWNIGGQIEVVPAYTQATLDEFFSCIDVLLFPTQWKESFGLTVREALLRDVWVIATDAGGVVEDIVDGSNGDIIPFGDDGTALRAAIDRRLALGVATEPRVNPFKSRIATFDSQADELHSLLAAAATRGEAARLDLQQRAVAGRRDQPGRFGVRKQLAEQ